MQTMKLKKEDGSVVEIQAVWLDEEEPGKLHFIDQRFIPFKIGVLTSRGPEETATFIRDMVTRGAPSIGAAGAYGIVQSAFTHRSQSPNERLEAIKTDAKTLVNARPTAVDLHNCVNEMLEAVIQCNAQLELLIEQSHRIVNQIIQECRQIAETGVKVVKKGMNILHHCHTGALATVDVGTALSIPILAHKQGLDVHVYVNETRPRLQGGRLTAWELTQEGVPHTVIADSVAASLMRRGEVDLVLVGADRIAMNGDVANKIGTYSLAVLASHHTIPIYSVAPWSTFDTQLQTGDDIPIEERSRKEVRQALSDDLTYHPIINQSSPVHNPAFDVTPNELLTGIITPGQILHPPLVEAIANHRKQLD